MAQNISISLVRVNTGLWRSKFEFCTLFPKFNLTLYRTRDGQNDEKNMLTIYTPGPILEKLGPESFSFEQVPGLCIAEKHEPHFKTLINQCLNAGYNLRWEIQNMAWHGLPQLRPRLIIVGAKIGFPIPPIAKPTHGPASSGLKPFHFIHDALRPLRRRGSQNDPHHQPESRELLNVPKIPYDPKRTLAPTITKSENPAHWSGKYALTVRELSMLQGFDINHHFEGTRTKIREAICNAWGPVGAKPQLLVCAATREAFDKGIIDAEDHIDDLYEFLESKGIRFPISDPQYRYINQLEKTIRPKTPLVVFARQTT